MNPSSFLLAGILATVYGAAFHVWQGGGWRRLILYLLAGWLGFGLGQLVGMVLGIQIFMIGSLYFFTTTLGCALALFAARWLALAEVRSKKDTS